MNKKRSAIVFGFFIFVLAILVLGNVSAVEPDTGSGAFIQVNNVIQTIVNFFYPFLTALLGDGVYQNTFEYLLFALILVAIIYMALSNVPAIGGESWILWTLTLASTILSLRFIVTQDLIGVLMTPSGVLGIALLTALPFIIYFWFVEVGLKGPEHRVARKFAWAIYAAVWLVLWYKQIWGNPEDVVVQVPAGWEYFYLIAAGIALLILLIDRTIQRVLIRSSIETSKLKYIDKKIMDLRDELRILEERFTKDLMTPDEYKRKKKDIEDKIQILLKS